MKKYKGVVFFDYDFTTIDATEQILSATSKTIESLNRLEENGYLTMLCSGRSKRFLEEDIDKFQGVITCNGAYAQVGEDVIRDEHISESLLRDIVNEYLPQRVSIHLETQDVTYCACNYPEIYETFLNRLDLPKEWFALWKEEYFQKHITKVVMYHEEERVFSDFQKKYSDQFQSVIPFEGEPFFDITLKGVTKGEAIRQILELYGIDRKDSYAFGDSDNDVEMLKAVGTGIVMAKHSVKAGKAATMFTGTVKEEGITQALEKLGLIS